MGGQVEPGLRVFLLGVVGLLSALGGAAVGAVACWLLAEPIGLGAALGALFSALIGIVPNLDG